MRNRTKLILTALAATMLLSFAASPALARTRIEVSPNGNIRATTPELTFASNIARVICEVTLTGTIARLITKSLGSVAGSITRIDTANPRGVEGAGCSGLPNLTITYGAIFGSLPNNITGGLLITTGGFRIEGLGGFLNCLIEAEIGASGPNPVTELTVLGREGQNIRRITNRGLRCPTREEARLEGTFTVSPTLTLRLLE